MPKGTETAGVKIFNFIRQNSSDAFVKVVPSATKDNIGALKDILFNDAYQPMLNEFVGNLINRIGLTIIRNKSFDNPLAMFKKGSVPLGTDIQDIHENPAEPEQYEYSNTAMAKLLTITDPDTHVAYYRLNRKDLYTKTIAREGLKQAFVSWDDFEKYVGNITNSLYSGNYISEFKYTKALVDGAYDTNKVIMEKIDAVTNGDTAKAFVKIARKFYSKMKYPSTKYNAYSKFSGAKGLITTWTDEDRIVMIVKSDVLAEVDVEVLAAAFNIDSAKLMGRIVEVDEFENPEIQAVICDESWLQIYDNTLRFDEFYNARVMAWNEYLHAWGTYAICPFANAVMFVSELPKPVESMNIATNPVNVTGIGTTSDVTVTLTPSDATSDVEFSSDNELVFTVTKTDNKTAKVKATGVGTANLKALSDNGKSASTVVSVTAE